jgi:hypothetical protein
MVLGHDITDAGRNRISFDDALDSSLAVGCIGACDCTGWPQSSLACDRPAREVGHAREQLASHAWPFLQCFRRNIQERAQDLRPYALELPPERSFKLTSFISNRR